MRNISKKIKWERKCPNPNNNPNCEKVIFYSTKGNKNRAEKRNTNCKSCAHKGNPGYWKGKKRSEVTKRKIKEKRKLQVITEETKQKIKQNNAHYWKGKRRSEETKLKMRLSRLKNIEKNNGQVMPNHNPDACEIIRWFNMYYSFNFRHAENGGEVNIDGYYPDGIDETRKTIIEIDEKHHFNNGGTYKQKDIQRQRYLEGLGYKFIRVKI